MRPNPGKTARTLLGLWLPLASGNALAVMLLLALVLAGRVVAALSSGFTGDEAYTIVIARQLSLSYFDHPPLHQWIVHATALVTGETAWLRLPFVVMALAINVPLYGITRRLYDVRAAAWALFLFNVAAYFVLWPDGLIIPDVPMLLALAVAAWAFAEIMFAPHAHEDGCTALWLAVGACLGLAGLAKYSAALVAISWLGFLLTQRKHAHWFGRPQPYTAAILALAIFSPALIWNMSHAWASFGFQSERVGKGLAWSFENVTQMLNAAAVQVVLLSPFVAYPFAASIAAALRRQPTDDDLFEDRDQARDVKNAWLLWLILVPLALFTAMPLLGGHPIPHWFNSAWLFAFPLAGAWLSRQSERWLRTWSALNVTCAAVLLTGYFALVTAGPVWLPAKLAARITDPTVWSYNWPSLTSTATWRSFGDAGPPFAAVNFWRVGGKAGLALGPKIPVCAFVFHTRGLAFACEQLDLVGRDALIVLPESLVSRDLPVIAQYFDHLGPVEVHNISRSGAKDDRLVLIHAYKLLRPYINPYMPVRTAVR